MNFQPVKTALYLTFHEGYYIGESQGSQACSAVSTVSSDYDPLSSPLPRSTEAKTLLPYEFHMTTLTPLHSFSHNKQLADLHPW